MNASHWYRVCWACMLAHAMYAALCMKGCCLLHVCCTEALRMLCYLLPAHPLAPCLPRMSYWSCCAMHCWKHALVSCTHAGVLHPGIPIRPCCATAAMLLRAACIPVSIALVYIDAGCWHRPATCVWVHWGFAYQWRCVVCWDALDMLVAVRCDVLICLNAAVQITDDCDYIMIVYASAQSTYEWFPRR